MSAKETSGKDAAGKGVSAGASAESAAEAARQLSEIKVADIVVQASTGLVTLGFVRLAGEQLDLEQARLAIDSLKALQPIVREQVSAELGNELGRAIASLQLAYADTAVPDEAEPGEQAASASDEGAQPAAG